MANELSAPGFAAIRHHLAPFAPFMENPAVTEIVVNKPGEFGVEAGGKWSWHNAPSLTFEVLDGIGMLASTMTGQTLSLHKPRCSTILPGGLRLQIARPPRVPAGTVSLTIRKRASDFTPTIEWLGERGYFDALPKDRDWVAWWNNAVRQKKTIALAGNTGSGKTTFLEALCRAIPLDERLVLIEKTPEVLLPHRNLVLSYYGASGDGEAAERAATEAVQDALRQRPDRILIGEIRSGGEAWAFTRASLAGHPGGIITVHAASAPGTIDALATIMRQDASGATMQDQLVRDLLGKMIDIVAHCDRNPYRLTEIMEV